jgi:16S rRNA (guanine966-N2)-methyltransferase
MNSRANQQRSAVRVIGGRWRGRKIPLATTAIRPTGDRVRETLFNWLAPYVAEARCLDWFAGSGALGIEALSRGAAKAVFVERDRQAARALQDYLQGLKDTRAAVLNMAAESALLATYGPFDLVFIDPPFDGPTVDNLCKLLARSNALAASAQIYLEMRRTTTEPELPDGWHVVKHKTAGQVSFMLVQTGD